MTLPLTQVEQFYRIWTPLLVFANEQLHAVPNLFSKRAPEKIDGNQAALVRNALWENEAVYEQFIEKNRANLSPEDLSILKTWEYRRQGTFIVYKAYKKHAIFISQDKRADVFAVKGLASSFEELFGPNLPIMVVTTLLPFKDEIIADGLFQGYNVSFGSGIRAEFKEIYEDAKERGEIITTLLPSNQSLSRESRAAKAEATNAKVLEAFQKFQYTSGLSPKTVERDQVVAVSFAQSLAAHPTAPKSLRDFEETELHSYLDQVPETSTKTARLSLKRLITFLRDTARMDWGEAANMLDQLKRAV